MDPTVTAALATVGEIIKAVGVPLAAVWWYSKYIAPNPNGKDVAAIREHLDGLFKDARQHNDMDRTRHFDQLRRDLTTVIEYRHAQGSKEYENALSRLTADIELFVLRAKDRA